MGCNIGPCSETPRPDLDPTLFALATTLPMSRFPIDDVDPSARYGPAEDTSRRIQRNACYDIMPRHHAISSPTNMPDLCPGSDWMNNEDFNSLPPLSASTSSSDWTSDWSANEPAPGFGVSCGFDAMPLSSGSIPSFLPGSYTSALDLFIDNFGLVAQGQLDYGWDELAPFELGLVMPKSALRGVGNQMPCSALSPGLFTNEFSGISFDTPGACQYSCLPTAPATPAAEQPPLLPGFPLPEDDLYPDRPFDNIGIEVDDFLNELGNTINWDSAVSSARDRTENSDHPNEPPGTSMARHEDQRQEPSPHDSAYSQHDWEHEFLAGDPEVFPDSIEVLLGEDEDCLLNPTSLDLCG